MSSFPPTPTQAPTPSNATLNTAIEGLAKRVLNNAPVTSPTNIQGIAPKTFNAAASSAPTWLVAYSGGVDSTALLHALWQWQQQQPQSTAPKLVAVMVNHGWRPAPLPELEAAMAQCKAWKIPLVLVPISKTTKPTETEARSARYEALDSVAQRENATAIWLAHHSDDQLETMLIRLCRGTGLEGLQGMTDLSPLPNRLPTSEAGLPSAILARPWLSMTKQSLIEYATANNLHYVTDPTNAQTIHPRNHLRHTVLPALEQAFPQAKESLKRFQVVASEAIELADSAINEVWPTMWDDTLGLDTTRLSQCAASLQGALIRQFLKHHHLLADYAHVQRVRAFITGDSADNRLDIATTGGSQLSVERPSRPPQTVDKASHWFLKVSQHRLTLIHKAPDPQSVTEEALCDESLESFGETLAAPFANGTLKPLAFRLLDLFPLRRPPAVATVSDNDDDDTNNPSPLNDLLRADGLDESLDEELDDTPVEDNLSSSITPRDEALIAEPSDTPQDESTEPLSPLAISDKDANSNDEITQNDTDPPSIVPERLPQEARPKVQHLTLSSGDECIIELITGDDEIPSPLPAGNSATIYATLEPFLVETLALRTPRAGDRIHPMGSLTSMRLSSYLASNGIKGTDVPTTPLLACGDEILWAVRVGTAEALRVTRRPTHRLTWVSATDKSALSSNFLTLSPTSV